MKLTLSGEHFGIAKERFIGDRLSMKKIILLLVLAPLTLSSCAALTRYKCNREYAAKKGMEDASAGLVSQPSRLDGNSCEGDYSAATFSKDYNYGFQQKKMEVCQVSAAAATGRTDGEAGQANQPQKTKLNLCSDLKDAKKIEAAYDSAFKKAYCAPARASAAGIARAQAWAEPDFETAFADCGATPTLKRAYSSAFNQTMSTACTTAEAERFGTAEATAKKPAAEGLARIERCGAVGKGELKNVFERAYQATNQKLERDEAQRVAVEAERVRNQRIAEFQNNVATAAFPFQLRNYTSRCQIAGDRSYVQVEVENRYPEQVLIQGSWKVIYYNNDFTKITEDRTTEAVLVTGQNKKTFQKMTLPRDASFCRAEFLGANLI